MAQFTYGRKVRDLLLELKRSDWLPVYNDSLVRDVMEEIKALEKEIVDTIECVLASASSPSQRHTLRCTSVHAHPVRTTQPICLTRTLRSRSTHTPLRTHRLNGQEAMRRDFAVMCGLTVHFESCKRNKKCLIAYLQHRLYKIRALRWETGRVVPENLRHTISRREHDYYDGYDTLLVNYMESVGDNLTAVRVCPFADDNLILWRELASVPHFLLCTPICTSLTHSHHHTCLSLSLSLSSASLAPVLPPPLLPLY